MSTGRTIHNENVFRGPHTLMQSAARGGAVSCTSQLCGPHYNANFWTLGGPHLMTLRAAFGPRAALLTPLI